MFRALRYRNFQLFFIGQGISLIGTWMQYVAISWLVYRLTNSVFLLGVVGFASQIPTFILSPITGVLADRWDRRRILIFTQILAMVQASILAFLTLKGIVAIWQIIFLGILLGCVNSLDIPARQAFIIDMVERKDLLGNAISLNSFMFNLARLLGPSFAGMIIGFVGEGPCFFINGISFLAVIICLFLMKIKKREIKPGNSHVLQGLKEGVQYTFGFAPIRYILILLSFISLMGMSYVVLMPVFAKDILHGGPHILGFLMSAAGLGALVATAFLAAQKKMVKLGNIIPVSSAIFAFGIISFSFSRILWFSLILLAVAGFGFMVHMAVTNIVLQTIVDDDKRGRVMSFYTMAFMGMAPLGSLLAGSLAYWLGATQALIIGGIFCFLASLVFATKIPMLKGLVHHIYEKISVVPEVVIGINTPVELTVPAKNGSNDSAISG